MLRTLALLALVCICADAKTYRPHPYRTASPISDISDSDLATTEPMPFRAHTEHRFLYNVQIASGLVAPADEDAASTPQQKAVMRGQCLVRLQFASERYAQLRLEQCRVGEQNEPMSEPQKVQPMGAFEPKLIPEDKQNQLELPCQFSYEDGVIERVQFHETDDVWSKNMKRAVLNMIQMKKEQSIERANQSKTYTVPETTLEGACQTTYTIYKLRGQQQQFNVTKSINFKHCQQIADVAYGYQTQQPQARCAMCQQQFWTQQQREQQPNDEQNPCAKCDPKELKEQELDRSTVIRCQIQQDQDQPTALKRCELVSQYVYRNSKIEDGKYGSAMQMVVSASLEARGGAQLQAEAEQQIPAFESGKQESMMYSNQWEMDVKRFYMFGDDEFGQNGRDSPFARVPKMQQAEQALRKLAQAMEDKQRGIEQQAPAQLQRLVEMLRQCTQADLKSIEQKAQNAQEKQILTNAMAVCGTRNCVARLAEKIKNKEINSAQAVQTLLALNQIPAPSDPILQEIEQLCTSSEAVKEQPALKQSCWMTFGALVNELCQYSMEQNMNNNGQQRGFLMEEQQCPMVKKQQYKEAMLTMYKNSECIYDKMVALNALGNAGLDISVMDLEQIIRDASEARVVRVKAIDALRRLRVRMPRRIQRILTPIFQNTREHPQVRTAAFAIIMYTQPESQLVDQLMYTIGKEPNMQVRAFAYRTMKMMANSQNPNERKIAQHIKAALKVANVDEDELRAMSGKWQVPLLYNAEQREGLFATVATTISTRSALPVYAHAQLDSQFNEQFQHNAIKLYMMQQEAEQWYGKMTDNFKQFTSISRAERQTKGRHNDKLRNIFKVLGIKNRLSDNYYQEEDGNMMEQSQNMNQPFAMLCLRTNDVDRGFWALDQHIMSEQTQKMLSGEMNMLGFVELMQNQLQPIIDGAMVAMGNLNEKQARIPTSAGMTMKLLNSMPMTTNIRRGQTRISIKMDGTITMGMKGQVAASVAHIQKMECWTPFLASGMQSIRLAELNLPLDAEINADLRQAAISIKVNLPRQETQLAAIHSLPITYTATVDPRTGLMNEPSQMRTIHNLKLERQQHEMDTMWKTMGMPIRVQGFFHCPSTPSFEQLVQMLMATENLVLITYQPEQNNPRELFFRAKSTYFQKAKSSEFEHPQQLGDFYNIRLDSAYSCEASEGSECDAFAMHEQHDAQELEQQQERQQQLNTFMEQYKNDGQQYKHSLKLSMQTDKNARAQCEMQMQCDAGVQFCKVQMKADRTPMFPEESRKWTLKADAQLLMPETDAAPMTQKDQKTHKQFIARVQAQWGEQQKVNIRVHGMQAYTAQVRHILQQQQQEGRDLVSARQMEQLKRRTAFLNKFHVEAQYSLKAKAQNAVRRMIEVLKSAYFWNTNSQLTEFGIQREGKAMATMVIDPLTRKHANMTIKTPEQRVRIHQIELPFRIRPFSLIHMQGAQQTHSLTQLFNRFNVDKRAECTADGETVKTFDYYEYASPLMTSCYSVLAKDCSSDQQTKFAVMMKKATQNAQPWKKTAKNGQNEQKAIKVLTPEQEIECQPKPNSQSLVCWIDGQQVNPEEQQLDQAQIVQYNNDQMDDVTIKVEGIAVRFNGRKAWLKVSPMYKGAVCGLCGHYDDSTDREDEWHMADGKIANDLAQFHRSYALSDTKVCTQQELDRFYKNDENKENQGEFHRQLSAYNDKYRMFGWVQDAEQFYGQSDAAKFGTYKSIFGLESKQTWQCCCCCADDDTECKQDCMRNEICQEMCRNKWCQKQQEDQEEGKEGKVSPVLMTKVSEQHHAVCFSAKPVKECPRGTMWYADGDDDEAQQQQQKTVRFVCMERADPEARRLLRLLRQGQRVVDVPEERGTSFTDRVPEPQQCRPYRGRF